LPWLLVPRSKHRKSTAPASYRRTHAHSDSLRCRGSSRGLNTESRSPPLPIVARERERERERVTPEERNSFGLVVPRFNYRQVELPPSAVVVGECCRARTDTPEKYGFRSARTDPCANRASKCIIEERRNVCAPRSAWTHDTERACLSIYTYILQRCRELYSVSLKSRHGNKSHTCIDSLESERD
jgi:hypothetical protein